MLETKSATEVCSSEANKKGAPGPSDLVYINVDAVIFKSYSSSAIGVLFRNHMGTRLLACRKSFCGITEVAEALTLRRAVVLTLDQDFHSVVLQSNCLALILKINVHVRDRTTTCSIVADIKSLACNFAYVSFTHVGVPKSSASKFVCAS